MFWKDFFHYFTESGGQKFIPSGALKDLTSDEQATIEQYANGDQNAKCEAINIYRRNRWTIDVRMNIYLGFMAEVASLNADEKRLTLYRNEIAKRQRHVTSNKQSHSHAI